MAFQTGMCDESALFCIVQLVTAPCAADRSIFEPVVLRVTYGRQVSKSLASDVTAPPSILLPNTYGH